jgi:hypothetical protein
LANSVIWRCPLAIRFVCFLYRKKRSYRAHVRETM